ncbi:hypothetical protein B5X24_HaOG209337 [Helicoverpa armigera]|nr:hypothetical protein B5X24_HaOG209337 [Helicoverpa armigera]
MFTHCLHDVQHVIQVCALYKPRRVFATVSVLVPRLMIQLGEELLAAGDFEAGVEHLGQAVAVCGQTQELLSP